MKTNVLLTRPRLYPFIGFVLVVVLALYWKSSRQEKVAASPLEGWVYMSGLPDGDAYAQYSGRPGKLVKGSTSTVEYQLPEDAAPHPVVLPHDTVHRLKPCPPSQEGVRGDFAGTIRIWKGDENTRLPDQGNHRARVGDTVTVEVKNFDRWLCRQYDFDRLSDDFADAPASLKPILTAAVQARHCQDMLKPFYNINDILRGSLKRADRLADPFADPAANTKWQEMLREIERDPILKQMAGGELGPEAKFNAANEHKARTIFYPLKVWLERVTEKRLKQLTLTLNGVTLIGLTPQNPANEAERYHEDRPSHRDDVYQWLSFELKREEASATATDKEREDARANENAWQQLVGRPAFDLPCNVTLRLPDKDLELPTKITKNAATPDSRFSLIGIDRTKFYFTLAASIVVLFLLGLLIATTDILRDSGDRLRADGLAPLSLGKAQMAFWFVLIGSAYIFLWITTERIDTINDTCLILLGIGSGTALGAAFIGDAQSKKPFLINATLREARAGMAARIDRAIMDRLDQLLPVTEGQDAEARQKVIADICQRSDDAILKWLKGDLPTGETLPAQDSARAALAVEIRLLVEQRSQLRKLAKSGWELCMSDLLREDDSGRYSFHRFQMVGWTIILGLVFVFKVLGDRTMPEFNTTTLALLGISAGTYLGFKLPGTKKEPPASAQG